MGRVGSGSSSSKLGIPGDESIGTGLAPSHLIKEGIIRPLGGIIITGNICIFFKLLVGEEAVALTAGTQDTSTLKGSINNSAVAGFNLTGSLIIDIVDLLDAPHENTILIRVCN